MKAVVTTTPKVIGVRDVPVPSIPDGAVLVKVTAVAINPTDWKHVEYGWADPGSISGCDFAGVVEEVGPGVTDYQKGDRITGVGHGG